MDYNNGKRTWAEIDVQRFAPKKVEYNFLIFVGQGF